MFVIILLLSMLAFIKILHYVHIRKDKYLLTHKLFPEVVDDITDYWTLLYTDCVCNLIPEYYIIETVYAPLLKHKEVKNFIEKHPHDSFQVVMFVNGNEEFLLVSETAEVEHTKHMHLAKYLPEQITKQITNTLSYKSSTVYYVHPDYSWCNQVVA